MTKSTPTYAPGETVHIAPSDLLVDFNIRSTADLDHDLIASIKTQGVLVPIVAVVTDDHRLRVRYGQRRTLAAIEAKRDTVPVYIIGQDNEPSGDAAAAARIITQRDENTHRKALSTHDDAHAIAQLAAFGLSPAQIAKQARITRETVEASLAVAESALASKAAQRHSDLTLEQAATLAEFEDDTETVTALMAAAKTGQFDHVAQRARDTRADNTAIATFAATLQAAGVRVIENPYGDDKVAVRLSRLHMKGKDSEALTEDNHANCPGRVAWISLGYRNLDAHGNEPVYPPEPEDTEDDAAWDAYEQAVRAVDAGLTRQRVAHAEHGCDNPTHYGHHDRYALSSGPKVKAADKSPEDREADKKARRLVIENNKAWKSAETVRHDWINCWARAKTPPKGTARFLAVAFALDGRILSGIEGNKCASVWLGKEHTGHGRADLSPTKSATDNRCLMITLLQVLGCYEADLTDGTWRHDNTHTAAGRYLRFLKGAGYTLSGVEAYALSNKTA